MQLLDFNSNLLIFIRCELAANAFRYLREFYKQKFTNDQQNVLTKESIQVDGRIEKMMKSIDEVLNHLLAGHTKRSDVQCHKLCPY